MSFAVAGTVKMTYAEEGQRVSKGELLARLDTVNLSSAYYAAKAQLSQAEDAMRRVQKLYDSQSIPEIKYIDVQTQLEKARSMEAIARKISPTVVWWLRSAASSATRVRKAERMCCRINRFTRC